MDVNLELGLKISRRDFRVLLPYEFRLDHKAASNICSTIGKDILSIRTAHHWFNQFKNSNLELDDLLRSGRALEVNLDVLRQLIQEDSRLTTWCLAERLGCVHATVKTHLEELGKTWKYGVWIPDELSPHQLQLRFDDCIELIISHRNYR